MTPDQMARDAAEALQGGTRMTMVLPRPWRNKPKKFPRGELMCEQNNAGVYSFDPLRVLAWLAANNLIKVKLIVKPEAESPLNLAPQN